jgi:formylglycine-generating enzyme required for sulfatase activity
LSAHASAGEIPVTKAFTNSIGMKFVRIEPGEFVTGTADRPPRSEQEWAERDWDESPTHKVKMTRAFHLGVFEVTNAQYERFDPTHGTRMSCVAFNEAWLKEGTPIRQPRRKIKK